jgi:hypothetical protein
VVEPRPPHHIERIELPRKKFAISIALRCSSEDDLFRYVQLLIQEEAWKYGDSIWVDRVERHGAAQCSRLRTVTTDLRRELKTAKSNSMRPRLVLDAGRWPAALQPPPPSEEG